MPDANLNYSLAGWPYLDPGNYIDTIPAYTAALATLLAGQFTPAAPTPAAVALLPGRVTALETAAANTPTLSGTGANTAARWDNGLQLAWLNTAASVAINSAYGPLFTGAYNWVYAQPFISVPTVICGQFKHTTSASWGTPATVLAASCDLRAMDAYNRAAGSCAISALAIGKWK